MKPMDNITTILDYAVFLIAGPLLVCVVAGIVSSIWGTIKGEWPW